MKVLIVAHFSRFLVQFEMNNVKLLQQMGYEVHYATNYEKEDICVDAPEKIREAGVILHQIDFVRSPYQYRENYRAYQQLCKLLEKERFDLVHCHTPMGAALARLAAKPYRKQGTKVIYTAHGFHFYKGAPLKYWLLFYPVERFLANYTDVLITINEEDYERAKRFCRHKKTRVEHIPGVGVDTAYFSGKELSSGVRENIRRTMREKLNVTEKEVVFLSVGELIPRKNHRLVLQALAELEREESRPFCYFICGQGVLKEELQQQIEEDRLSEKVTLLGYREDIRELLYAADVFVFPSLQEGMPVALMEAVAAGLPVIASDIRGNRELSKMQEDVQLFSDEEGLKRLLQKAIVSGSEARQAEEKPENRTIGLQEIDRYQVSMQMQNIYKETAK